MKSCFLAGWMTVCVLGMGRLAAQNSPAPDQSPAPDGGPVPAPDGGPAFGGGAGAGGGEARGRIVGFLPPAEQERVRSAYTKAVAAHPELQTESRQLMKDMPGYQNEDVSPEQRQALLEKWRSHREKMRKAMLAEDPTLGPILDKIDKHMSQMRAQHERESTAPPAQ